MPAAELEKFLWEAISFGVFLAVCGGLLKRRYSPAATLLAGAAWVGCVLLAQGALLWSGREATLVLTLLPLTAYLPTAAVVHLLSARGFFPTAAVWTVGAMACTFLRLVRKLLLWGLNRVDWLSGGRWEQAVALSLLLAAAVLVFLILRFLRKPFLGPLLEGNPGWLPLCFPVLMVFLFLSYFASSTTRPVLLVLSAVTALSVPLLLAGAACGLVLFYLFPAAGGRVRSPLSGASDCRPECPRPFGLGGYGVCNGAAGGLGQPGGVHRLRPGCGFCPGAPGDCPGVPGRRAACRGRPCGPARLPLLGERRPDLRFLDGQRRRRFRRLRRRGERRQRTTATLSSLYKRLRAYPGFFQPHRAYIVNLAYVRSLGAGQLTLAEGRRVPVSRGAAAALKQAYLEFAF
ncbi:MAG TPA: LytTR family transcriptional regulator [Candidatus Anaerotruncus excrementipullorum]|uniref:LytTR family transcriptional regulator n=1 Tax=Candidatus Anaerotruncus excrementipullorum TaxID=2838465 RepID=A0A9D1WPF7_9FIRM|nr:LytTR family transcriptional regulator [Candidatus Anaerotruncus excrementipullorum]